MQPLVTGIGNAVDEGVFRVNVSVGDVSPGENATIQVTTFLDKSEPRAPGENPPPINVEDIIFIGNVSIRLEIVDDEGISIDLQSAESLWTDDNGSLEIHFRAPLVEGEYNVTVWAVFEGEEYKDSKTFTVTKEARLEPTPSPAPGVEMGISALKAWTNGTVSFRVRVYQGEMQVIDEVHVNELVYSWADGSVESAIFLVGEDKCWSIDVGVLNLGDMVYVEVKGNTESGYRSVVVEKSSRYSITIPLIIAGCFLLVVIGILVIRNRTM